MSITPATSNYFAPLYSTISSAIHFIFHQILFTLTGYNPQKIEEGRVRQLKIIDSLSNTPHLAAFVDKLSKNFGLFKAATLEVPKSIQWIIDAERDLIASITQNTLVFIFENLITASIETKHDRCFPLAAIARKVVAATDKERAGALLYRNNPSNFPAPYPINRLIARDIAFYFAAEHKETFFNFCNTDEIKKEPLTIDLVDYVQKAIEEKICESKESFIDSITAFISKADEERVFFKNWLGSQFDEIIKDGTINPAYTLIKKWIKAFLFRLFAIITHEDKKKTLINIFSDAAEKKISIKEGVDLLFTLLELDDGKGFGITKENADSLLIDLKNTITEALAQLVSDLFSLNDTPRVEEELISLTGSYVLKCVKDPEIFKDLSLNKKTDQELQESLYQLLFSEDRHSKLIQKHFKCYIENLSAKIIYGFKNLSEKYPDSTLTIKLLDRLLTYLEYHLESSENTPKCDELVTDLLALIDINQKNLPVPEFLKETIWNYITGELAPNLIKQLLSTHLSRESIEEYFKLMVVQDQGQGTQRQKYNYRAPEETRRVCVAITKKLLTRYRMNWSNYLNLEKQIGHQIADSLYQTANEWPMSLIYKKTIQTLTSLFMDIPECDDFEIMTPEIRNSEVHTIIGKMFEKEVKSGLKELKNGVKRQFSKGVHLVSKQVGAAIYSAGTNFATDVSQTLLPKELTESFLFIEDTTEEADGFVVIN